MKKFYIFLFSILFTQALNAQITLTNSDYPVAGSIVATSQDISSTVNIGSPSASSQTWDFSALVQDINDTMAYFDPTLTPQGSAFTTSDMATYDRVNQIYTYYQHQSGGLFIKGISWDLSAFGFGVYNVNGSPIEKYMPNPYSYGNTNSVNSKYEIKLDVDNTDYTDSIVRRTIIKKDTVDAWGTITTPSGTYNVLRVHSYQIESIDFIVTFFSVPVFTLPLVADTSHNYFFWTDTLGHPVASVFQDATGNTQRIEFLTSTEFPPTSGFIADKTTAIVGEQINFQNLSSGATSWDWDFGDANTSTKQSPSHSYSTPGLYTVKLISYNSFSSDTSEKIDYIEVLNAPVADFIADQTTVVIGDVINFTNLSSNSDAWEWDFGDGNFDYTQNPTHSYSASGTYTVKLVSFNAATSDTTEKINYILVNAVGINDVNQSKNIVGIYPNPASNQFMVDTKGVNASSIRMEITDLMGRVVKTISLKNNLSSVDVSEISSGVYVAKIYADDKIYSTNKISISK